MLTIMCVYLHAVQVIYVQDITGNNVLEIKLQQLQLSDKKSLYWFGPLVPSSVYSMSHMRSKASYRYPFNLSQFPRICIYWKWNDYLWGQWPLFLRGNTPVVFQCRRLIGRLHTAVHLVLSNEHSRRGALYNSIMTSIKQNILINSASCPGWWDGCLYRVQCFWYRRCKHGGHDLIHQLLHCGSPLKTSYGVVSITGLKATLVNFSVFLWVEMNLQCWVKVLIWHWNKWTV